MAGIGRFESKQLREKENFGIHPSVDTLFVGLGWDKRADIDASAVLFDKDLGHVDIVWFKKLQSTCRSVTHTGDNLTGEGDGDDETITVKLAEVPARVHHIAFAVTVYSGERLDKEIRNASVKARTGRSQGDMLCTYHLSRCDCDALWMGQLTRQGNVWIFTALGEPVVGRTILQILKEESSLRCLSRIQSIASRVDYVVVQVVNGKDLAARDRTGLFRRDETSDPYYIAEYDGNGWRSDHVSNTCNPVWPQKEIVLGNVMEISAKILKISVFDWNRFAKHEFMGEVQISVRELVADGRVSRILTRKLEPSNQYPHSADQITGTLRLKVDVRPETET